jgi:ABC-type transport system involved in Fe-S cluster assembly fused permease/ATPase subunit
MSIEEIRDLQKKTQEVLNQMIDVVPQDHILYPIFLKIT